MAVPRCRWTRRLLRASAALLVVTAKPLAAQDAPAPKPVRPATVQDLEKGPHTGPVEEALVGVRVVGKSPNGTPMTPRYGNGFVLRCDGFLVLPYDLFHLSADSSPSSPEQQTIQVFYRPGAEREQKISMPRRSRWFVPNMRRFGFVVFRTDGAVHVPSLRTLLPDTLKGGDTVTVAWRDWDANAGKFGPLVRKAARLANRPEGVNWQGLADETFEHPGRIEFSETIDGVPAGAVVLGPDDIAVGVIPGSGGPAKRDSFISFSALTRVTNCVSPVPTSDGSFRAAHADGQPDAESPAGDSGDKTDNRPGAMVRVPGGPVIVPKAILADQPDMEGEPIACMAPFQIDKLEVTNGEYLAFWNGLDEKQRNSEVVREAMFPLGWAPVGEPFPQEIAGLPVLGVPLAGAEAYAKAQGKRLPTPYEWAKAALGPKGETETPEWIRRYLLDRQKAWADLVRAHAEYLRGTPGLLDFAKHPIDEKGKPTTPFIGNFYWLPWVVLPKGYLKEERFSYEAFTQITTQLLDAWRVPGSVIAAGARKYDVSPYGAQDMLLNAWELYQPNPGTPVFRAPRYLAMEWVTEWAERGFWSSLPFVPLPWRGLEHGNNWTLGWPLVEATMPRLYKRTVRPRYRWSDGKLVASPPRSWPISAISFVANLDLAVETAMPIVNWTMVGGGLYELGSSGKWWPWGGVSPSFDWASDWDYPNYSVFGYWRSLHNFDWARGLLRFDRELGYPTPMQGTVLIPPQKNPVDTRFAAPRITEEGLPMPPDLYYILPVGFRCAR